MKMTAVVTAFNRTEALEKALRSLNAQTRLPEEVIVSDDGSEEDILTSIRSYSDALDFRIAYVRQKDMGFRLARCRNNAVRAAAGDYLVFLDQDTLITRGYLELHARSARLGEFLVAYPVMLDEGQSKALTLETIATGDYSELVTGAQLGKIQSQHRKDRFYKFLTRVTGRGHRPKLRGGAFGIYKEDLTRVDGFDENYVGWGTEDDDLGRRLYRAGITGRTVFLHDFPLHLWHPHVIDSADSPNLPYYNRRLKEIARGDYRAVNGLSHPLGDDEPSLVRVK